MSRYIFGLDGTLVNASQRLYSPQDYFISDMGKDIAIGNAAGLRTVAITHGFMSRERLKEYASWRIVDELARL